MNCRNIILASAAIFTLTSCAGWLSEDGPMTNRVEDFFTSEETAVQVVNAAYTPLMWEFQSTYYSEFFIGDIMSDDALKGGQNIADMADAYDLENFKAISNNSLVLDYYRANFQGIARANLALEQLPKIEDLDQALASRLTGEASFLRALYYFRLVRLFGGVPISESPIYSADGWKIPRSTVDQVYSLIVSDLENAAGKLPLKSQYAPEDLGRATKGAAEAMLLKVYLYWGDCKRNGGDTAGAAEKYSSAKTWGGKFIANEAAEYTLCGAYRDNFTLDGENGPESVFEVQYMAEGTSDYGEGNGFSRGTLATILLRSRSSHFSNSGWGFCHPTQNLYDEYEAGDPRRDASIFTPTDEEITTQAEELYLGNRYLTLKRTIMEGRDYPAIDHATRSPINRIEIRLADVYLLYAEACLRNDDASEAKTYLEKVRDRAREGASILPAFPGYKVPDYRDGYALRQLQDNAADLELAIRHERRVELAMESHRWYDLCRWGIAKEVMDAYAQTETDLAKANMGTFVKGKHELLPIPDEEVRIGSLEQNFGW